MNGDAAVVQWAERKAELGHAGMSGLAVALKVDLDEPKSDVVLKPADATAVEFYSRPLRAILQGDITELCVNGPGEVWVESRAGWERRPLPELTYETLRHVTELITNSSSQKISEKTPLVSTSLPTPTRERIQLVIPPAVLAKQISLTIRKPSDQRFSLADYRRQGAFEGLRVQSSGLTDVECELKSFLKYGEYERFFELAVRSKRNMAFSGVTGSGKTTFMKTCVDLIPSDERLLTIEDAPEMDIVNQPNHVRLFYSKGGQGVAQVTPRSLLEATLRMKPDRVLLAELRSDEAFEYMRNINAHPGSITSLHAASTRLALEQLILLIRQSETGKGMERKDVMDLVYMLVDVIVQFDKKKLVGVWYDPDRKYRIMDAL